MFGGAGCLVTAGRLVTAGCLVTAGRLVTDDYHVSTIWPEAGNQITSTQ